MPQHNTLCNNCAEFTKVFVGILCCVGSRMCFPQIITPNVIHTLLLISQGEISSPAPSTRIAFTARSSFFGICLASDSRESASISGTKSERHILSSISPLELLSPPNRSFKSWCPCNQTTTGLFPQCRVHDDPDSLEWEFFLADGSNNIHDIYIVLSTFHFKIYCHKTIVNILDQNKPLVSKTFYV